MVRIRKMKKKLENIMMGIVFLSAAIVYTLPIWLLPLVGWLGHKTRLDNSLYHNQKPAVEYRLNKTEERNYSQYISTSTKTNANVSERYAR